MSHTTFVARALQHPLEVAAALAARAAWGTGATVDFMVRSGLEHIGLMPWDSFALHAGLFLQDRMAG